ncbi:hypothetical protein THICB3320145 [Thiomonas sp. CB3]|nr:hypothetical protein THICB3320145 [Thiomonas sp. CB3]
MIAHDSLPESEEFFQITSPPAKPSAKLQGRDAICVALQTIKLPESLLTFCEGGGFAGRQNGTAGQRCQIRGGSFMELDSKRPQCGISSVKKGKEVEPIAAGLPRLCSQHCL